MKTRIQVLSIENKSGRSKATGNDYSMNVCQCVVYDIDGDGVEKILVGELVLPKNHPEVKPGMYEGEFGISVGQDKRIGGRLLHLTPVASRAAASGPAPAAPAPQGAKAA